ncbi:MAG: polymer-forming cytoskeletal protein [Candidatus Glassbacteria bacterium]
MKLRKDESDLKETGKMNSVIGPGALFSGECTVDGTLRIDGEMSGTVKASKMVIIGKTGVVKGDIHVEVSIVGGSVQGNINATGRVELQSGSSVEGDITTAKLIVEEGTIFNGKCCMGEGKDGPIRLFDDEETVEKQKGGAR